MKRILTTLLALSAGLAVAAPPFEAARELYQRTEYSQSLAILLALHDKDSRTLQLTGQDYYMLGEYKKATEVLERAAALAPHNAQILHWLGRTYGRRAETANSFTAPGYATKARQMLERSVAIDPGDKESTGDLLDFYLDAPGFLGGGLSKADALARLIGQSDPAEGHYAQAVIDEHLKDYSHAEEQLRRAAELAPRQVGRVMALAKYLAKRGRISESEAMFDQAARMAPDNPVILFERADTYIGQKRNLDAARELLQKYLLAPLTPDDPPRQQAEALLKKIGA